MDHTLSSNSRTRVNAWRLDLLLPRGGFPISQESLLLASEIARIPFDRALDLGCGVGVLACAMARMNPAADIHGIEIQPGLAEYARLNARTHGWSDRVTIHAGDAKQVAQQLPPRSFDLIVSNPPFRRLGDGLVSPDLRREISCSERDTRLLDLVRSAEWLLAGRGVFAVVLLPDRLPELLRLLFALQLSARTLRFVHHDLETEASALLLTASRSGKPLRLLPPVIIKAEPRTGAGELTARGGDR